MDNLRIVGVLGVGGDEADVWAIVKLSAPADYLLAQTIERVPVLVIPCIERRLDGGSLVGTASGFGSILPAAWSFLLALRSRGLGSVWTTAHLWNEAAAAELLGIPATVTQVAMFPVAHTVGTEFRRARRPPPESITSWERWGGSR